MADALFESNWQPTKDALCEGLTGNKRTVMETTLENTRQALMETAGAGATNAGNVATLNKVILPVIRRALSRLQTLILVHQAAVPLQVLQGQWKVFQVIKCQSKS